MYNWKSWKEVPLPPRMQQLEKDKRGYPIPYIVVRDNNNVPHFQVNDTLKVNKAIHGKLCSICGQPLGADMWLVGGPLSAFHPQGAYVDPCIHGDCGRYALKVCPYLAITKYAGRLDSSTLNGDNFAGSIAFFDPTVMADRPLVFVFVRFNRFELSDNGYLVPNRPYLDMEFWKEGNQLTFEQGIKLIQENS